VRSRGLAVLAVLCGLFVAPQVAAAPTPAGSWLPHAADATWTYSWTDSVYATTPTAEQVTVKSQSGNTFVLAWTTDGLNNPPDAVSSAGTVSMQETDAGLDTTDWTSTAPPTQFPILCATATSCGNSLAGVYYNIIWGSRQPTLVEPLLRGLSWSSTGGTQNDVASTSTYIGQQKVTVPAFPSGVEAAVVKTQVTQAGAIGDPYGSGTRTVWWVYDVGPVKVVFQHQGGSSAPVMTAVLQTTNQAPAAPPSDIDYFPMTKNSSLTYSWTNTKYLTKPEVEKFTIDAVVNDTARFTVKNISGPIKIAGSYGYSKRVDTGVTNLWGTTSSATLQKFPPLGPSSSASTKRNHFVSPFDLMNFGIDPIVEAYPAKGQTWSTTRGSNDFSTYGVTAKSSVVGIQKVKVPAGTFQALVVRTTLKQPGFPFGTGTRTCWFAPGKGLVKLVFDHADHSVSTVELIK
jgi:hypothetical protein